MTANPKIFLALDVGTSRIGLALARSDTRLPQPFQTLPHNDNWLNELKQIIDEQQVNALVVGLPRGLNGQDTVQTQVVRTLAEQLETLNLPIFLQDEALTS